MIESPDTPAAIVARALAKRGRDEWPQFLRELLAHTAAGILVSEGDEKAAEAVYRLGDAVAVRGRP